MKRGYVKLWRKVTDSGLIQHPSALQVFVWLLVNVAWKPTKYATRYGVMDIQTGEVIVGRKKLATLLNSTEQKIRTALAMLSNMEIITIESTSEFSRITLRNWDKYQTEISSQPAEQPAANQQLTTVKALKKEEPSSDKPKLPNGDFMKCFCEAWALKHAGSKYHVTPRDGQRMKLLLKGGLDLPRFESAVPAYLASNDEWIKGQGFPLWALCDNFNLYGVKANTKRQNVL